MTGRTLNQTIKPLRDSVVTVSYHGRSWWSIRVRRTVGGDGAEKSWSDLVFGGLTPSCPVRPAPHDDGFLARSRARRVTPRPHSCSSWPTSAAARCPCRNHPARAARQRARRSGSVSELGAGRWLVGIEAGRDPVTGGRRRQTQVVRGSREEAEIALARLRLVDNGGDPQPATNARTVPRRVPAVPARGPHGDADATHRPIGVQADLHHADAGRRPARGRGVEQARLAAGGAGVRGVGGGGTASHHPVALLLDAVEGGGTRQAGRLGSPQSGA